MQDGKINPVTGIFWQKNYDGLKDQQEQVIIPANPLGDSTDAETLRRRYLEQKEIQMIPEQVQEEIPEVAESAERTPAEADFDGSPESGS